MNLKEKAKKLKKDIPVILLPLLIALTIKCIPNEVMEECRIEAEDLWNNGKPKRWYYAVPIIAIWILILIIMIGVIKAITR